MKSFRLFLIAMTTAFVACATPADSLGRDEKIGADAKPRMLQIVNEARAKGCKCGNTFYPPAPALKWNEKLESAAKGHSSEMHNKNYFSHTSKDGRSAGERIKRSGYTWKTYGENIGMGFAKEKDMVEAWLKSPGHCKNIMSKDFTEMGAARVGQYWTQTFGAR